MVTRSRIPTSGGDADSDALWSENLQDSLDEVPIDVVVTAAELAISVDQLSNLKLGIGYPYVRRSTLS